MKFSTVSSLIASLAVSVNAYDLLKDYAGSLKIGVAANTGRFNSAEYVEALSPFNYMVAENGCKLSGIQQSQGKYDFTDCDNHYAMAEKLGMGFRGHCLVWHSYQPQWFENADATTLKSAIVDHINTVLEHYKGKIDAWDVVNEAIDDSSNGQGWVMRNSFLYKNVPDFVDLAFQTARKADPSVKLFYNDYNNEGTWAKSESVYNFVEDLVKRNIPIDGIGMQYHVSVQYQPTYDKINNLMKRYCDLGLELHITELDVSCENQCGSENAQAEVYTNALKACLANSCCKAFLVWGVGDNDSWLGADKKGLLFNSNYQPKAQYTALLDILKSNNGSSSSNGSSSTAKTIPVTSSTAKTIPVITSTKTLPIITSTKALPDFSTSTTKALPVITDMPVESAVSTKTIPVEITTKTIPVVMTTKTIPSFTSAKTIPVEITTKTIPVEITTKTIPVEITTKTIPVEITTKTIPAVTTAKTIPVQQTTQQPIQSTQQPIQPTQQPSQPTQQPSQDNNGNCAAEWAQCGGNGFNGPTCCQTGNCVKFNDWYSQCIKN